MAEKVLMLALSPTMETGTIAKWTVQEGNSVHSGDVLCEVETDKAVMDYESIQEGILLKIILAEGGEAQVGEPIAIIGEQGEDISSLLTEVQAAPQKVEIPPEKPTTAVEEMPVSPVPETGVTEQALGGKIKSSPLARKMAKEAGIDLRTVRGSGPGGRIIQRDIGHALEARQAKPVTPEPSPPVPIPVSTEAEIIRVSQKRKVIAQRLAESKFSAPHYYLKVTVKMDEVIQARKTLNARLTEKVSLNAFLLKFVAEVLKKHPMLNSSWNGDTITKHGTIDIGLAVAQPDGLITPVVRNCANKRILEIDQELNVLIQKAQSNRLSPEEYAGATFTITSLGSFGIQEFTAIINPPGSAILAIGEIQKQAVVGDDDQIVIQSNMTMTLSCDHRVIDGVVGAAFLKELKETLENPIRALY